MSDDFYPFVDSGDPAPENTHLTGAPIQGPMDALQNAARHERGEEVSGNPSAQPLRAARISVYDDMLSTPRVIVVEQGDVRTYLEDVTNTVYRTMKEQGGHLTLMIIRELVENFIHAQFSEPIISILDNGDTIRFSDQGPGIGDKELAFEFGVTSASRDQKRYIRGTGSGLPMIQQYVENAGGAIALEDNLGAGTVVTVSVNPERVQEIEQSVSRGAAVRSGSHGTNTMPPQGGGGGYTQANVYEANAWGQHPSGFPNVPGAPIQPMMEGAGSMYQTGGYPQGVPANGMPHTGFPPGAMPQQPAYSMQPGMYPQPQQYGYPQFGNQFSTIQQPYGQPAGMYPPQPFAQSPAMGEEPLHVSRRGVQALQFICENESGGPTDLTRMLGSSNGTWSRELATLAKVGLIHKTGQKYVLTEKGRTWVSQNDR